MIRMFRSIQMSVILVALLAGIGPVSCGEGDSDFDYSRPDSMFFAMRTAVNEDRPILIWNAMPSSWRADINGLVMYIGYRIDAKSYEQLMKTLGLAVRILADKKPFILNSAIMQRMNRDDSRILEAQRSMNLDLQQADLDRLEGALRTYYVQMGDYPSEDEGLAVLWSKESLEEDDANAARWTKLLETAPVDRWGNEVVYQRPSQLLDTEGPDTFDLISFGPDGEQDTEDDITNHDRKKNADGEIESASEFSGQGDIVDEDMQQAYMYDLIVAVLKMFVESDLRTAQGLKQCDLGKLVQKHGPEIMRSLKALSQLEDAMAPAELMEFRQRMAVTSETPLIIELINYLSFQDVTSTVDSTSGDEAMVTVTLPGRGSEQLMMKMVVGDRWVPAVMALGWPLMMDTAKGRLARVDMAELNTILQQIQLMLPMINQAMAPLETARTQEEFDQAMMQMEVMMAMAMQSLD